MSKKRKQAVATPPPVPPSITISGGQGPDRIELLCALAGIFDEDVGAGRAIDAKHLARLLGALADDGGCGANVTFHGFLNLNTLNVGGNARLKTGVPEPAPVPHCTRVEFAAAPEIKVTKEQA
jgi:hypothetical protein